MNKKSVSAHGLDVSVDIKSPTSRVLKAFFDPDALGAWWQAAHSVTTPRMLGPYAIEWQPTTYRDEVLGRLGGVFRGTVMQFDASTGFFVADAFWLPPDGDPIGPMALEVTLRSIASDSESGGATVVRVVQTGFGDGVRWRRYYEIVGVGWERALKSLKMLLEQ